MNYQLYSFSLQNALHRVPGRRPEQAHKVVGVVKPGVPVREELFAEAKQIVLLAGQGQISFCLCTLELLARVLRIEWYLCLWL